MADSKKKAAPKPRAAKKVAASAAATPSRATRRAAPDDTIDATRTAAGGKPDLGAVRAQIDGSTARSRP